MATRRTGAVSSQQAAVDRIPRQRTTSETMALAAAGDRDAFARIYVTYERLVLRYVWSLTHNRDLTEDIAAATWTKALASVRTWVDQGRDPAAWLVTIARNLVTDYLKSGRRRFETPTADPSAEPTAGYTTTMGPDPADLDEVRELYAAIAKLKNNQRHALLWRLNGLDTEQTAFAMGTTPAAVKALVYRAKQNLRSQMAPRAHLAPPHEP